MIARSPRVRLGRAPCCENESLRTARATNVTTVADPRAANPHRRVTDSLYRHLKGGGDTEDAARAASATEEVRFDAGAKVA
jgi:hypothetical protein